MKKRRIILFIVSCIFSISLLFGMIGIGAVQAENANTSKIEPKSLWTEVDNNLATVEQNVKSPDFVQIGWVDKWLEYTQDNLCPVPEYIKTGVRVTVPTGNIAIQYKNVINLNSLDNSVPLLDWLPVAENRGTASILRFTVRLEDITDTSNYLEIYFYHDVNRMRWGFDFLGREKTVESRWDYGDMGNTPVNHFDPFNAIISPYSLRYEKSTDTYSLYCYKGDTTLLSGSISPSDQTLYDTKTFKGFSSNLVKMTVTANSLAGTSSYFLYNVAGQGMNGETILDEQAPSFYIAQPEKIAKAYVGKSYRLFDANAYDIIDGELDYQIRLFEPGYYKNNYTEEDYTIITGDSFVPTKEGTYSVVYCAKDSSGNDTEKVIKVQSAHEWDDLNIIVEKFSGTLEGTDNVFHLGTEIAIPNFTVIGGSGVYDISIFAIFLLDNEELVIQDGYLRVNKAGNYKIVISVVDYCGNKLEKNVYFDVLSTKLPILKGELNMFKAFCDDSPVELPILNAYDYSTYLGLATIADLKIVAIGANNYSKEVYNSAISSSRVAFLPDKQLYGESVKLQYIYKCKKVSYANLSECLVKEYIVPIKESAKYLTDYFYISEGIKTGGNTEAEYKNVQRYISMTVTESNPSSFGFINPIAAENIYVEMDFPANGQKFSGFTIRFSDAFNSDIGFEVTIYKIGGTYTNKSLLKYNDREFKIIGGFDIESGDYGEEGNSPIALSYKGGTLYDYSGLPICAIDSGFNGKAFEGFPSGAARLEFCFNMAEAGAQVNFLKIADQNMFLKYKNGIADLFVDQIKPIINVETNNVKYKFGETVKVPSAKAFDTITSGRILQDGSIDVIRVMVEVKAPNGDVLIEKQELSEGLSFSLTQYGEFRIIYTATDNKGKISTSPIVIEVEDQTKPILTIEGNQHVINATVNQKIKLPSVVALDNFTPNEYLKLSCIVIAPNGTIEVLNVSNQERYVSVFEYTPKLAGEYTVVYLVEDESGNMAMQMRTLLVGEV